MNIKALRVGARRYVVGQARRVDDKAAEVDPDAEYIVISPRLSVGAAAEYILHESLHAMLDNAGIDIDENEVTEEMVVSALAPRLAAFLADNESAVHELLDMLSAK